MSFFRGKSQASQAAQLPTYTGLQLPTATSTLPIPVIWGKTKTSVNVIFYGGFTPVPELSATNRSGKGFLGSKGGGYQITGWFYLADLLLGICEGEIAGIGNVFKGQSVFPFAQMGTSLFVGSDTQPSYSYIDTNYPGRSLTYRHTAYIGAARYNLGNSAALGSLNIEVKGLSYATGFNGEDSDPGEMIIDMLSDPNHGAYFPADEIVESDLVGASGDSSVQSYCWALGIALSPCVNQYEPANSILARWLRAINTAAFMSQGKLRFVPFGDEPLSGNGRSWVPPVQDTIELTEDDFVILSEDQDPVEFSHPDPLTLPTVWRAEVLSRGEDLDVNQYQPILVEARDLSRTVGFGQRAGTTESFHEICEVDIGAKVVQILLQREVYLKSRVKFFLDWRWVDLDPMDIVYLTSLKCGLSMFSARILEIEEDEDGICQYTCEQFVPGINTPGPNHSVGTIPVAVNTALAPNPVNAVLIYEPPVGYTSQFNAGGAQIWFGASGGVGSANDPNWGGCYVHASVDGGTSYTELTKIVSTLAQGVLTDNTPSVSGFDVSSTLKVDLSESGGSLDTITDIAAQSGGNLSLVNSELICFATASLTGFNAYTITRMQRGMYGTTPASHSIGTGFAQLDNVAKVDLPPAFIGHAVKFKFQSFNKYGEGLQDLSACTPYDYTPTGVGQGGVQVTTVSQTITLSAGLSSVTTSIQIPAEAVLLAVTAENLTLIVGSAGLTGYLVDPVYESNGAANTPSGEFTTGTLANGGVFISSFASKQWSVVSALKLTTTGTSSPTFTSGQIRISIRYMTV